MELLERPLERDGPIPIFQQIRERLEQAIVTGELGSHERIPSERELSEGFGVSRMTIRQALGALTQSGRLYSRNGRGTFVAERKIEQPLQRLTSFTQDMLARGVRPSSRLLSAEVISAPLDLAESLEISPGAEVVRIARLRLADEQPVALETSHLPHRVCRGILENDLSTSSLYQLLAERYGVMLGSARQTIEAAEPSHEEHRLLALSRRIPVLRIRRVTSASGGGVVEFVRAVYRGDRYQLQVELH